MSTESSEIRDMQAHWDSLTETISDQNKAKALAALDKIAKRVAELGAPPATLIYRPVESAGTPSKKDRKKVAPDKPDAIYSIDMPLTPKEFATLPEEQRLLIKNAEQMINDLLTPVELALKQQNAEEIEEAIKWRYWLALSIFRTMGANVNLLSDQTLARYFWSPEMLPKDEFDKYRRLYTEEVPNAAGGKIWASLHLEGDLEKSLCHPLHDALTHNAGFASKMLLMQEPVPDRKKEAWKLMLDYPKKSLAFSLHKSLRKIINHERHIKERVATELGKQGGVLTQTPIFPESILRLIQDYVKSKKKKSKVYEALHESGSAYILPVIVKLINDYVVVINQIDISQKELDKLSKDPSKEKTTSFCNTM